MITSNNITAVLAKLIPYDVRAYDSEICVKINSKLLWLCIDTPESILNAYEARIESGYKDCYIIDLNDPDAIKKMLEFIERYKDDN